MSNTSSCKYKFRFTCQVCGRGKVYRKYAFGNSLEEALDILCTAIERARTAEDPGNREERLLAEREYLADMQRA